MSLENLKRSKVDEVRREIKAINYQHVTSHTYEGKLSDEEARREYQKLLDILPDIPGLTDDERNMLQDEIQQRIDTLGKYENSEYNLDTITDEESFRKAVERVHYEHRYDAGAMFGTLTDYEAEKDYKTLLSLLNDVRGFSDEFKSEMRILIEEKIKNIPAVQEEKREEMEAYEEEFKAAFEEAKERFNSLGYFKRLKLRKEGKAPEQLKTHLMGVDQVKRLYRK